MTSAPRDDVTRWLRAWSNGDETVLERLTSLVYGELRQRPRGLMGRDWAGSQSSAYCTRKFRVVELRFFGGFSVDDVGDFLEVSQQNVLRDWRRAKAWLQPEVRRGHRGRS